MNDTNSCFEHAESIRDQISEMIKDGSVDELNLYVRKYGISVIESDAGKIIGHTGLSGGVPFLGTRTHHDPDLMKFLNTTTLNEYRSCRSSR